MKSEIIWLLLQEEINLHIAFLNIEQVQGMNFMLIKLYCNLNALMLES